MLDQCAVAERDELARDVDRHVHLRFAGIGAEVRRDDAPRVLDQPADHFTLRRLLAPDVDRRASDVTGLERGEEGALVPDAAARAVHDPHAALRQGELARRHHVLRLRRERHVKGDDVGLAKHRLEIGEAGAEVLGATLRDVGIVHEQLGLEGPQARRDPRADLAKSDDADRLPEELGAVGGSVPLERLQSGVGIRNAPHERQQHAHGVLGRGDHVAVRGVADEDASPRARVDVDVVDPDPGAADDAQAGLARKTAIPDMSSIVPQRPAGVRLSTLSWRPLTSRRAFCVSSVSIHPGSTAFTWMLSFAHADDKARVSWTIPPLLAEYAGAKEAPKMDIIEPMLMILPRPAAFIGAYAAREQRKALVRFVSRTRRHSASV